MIMPDLPLRAVNLHVVVESRRSVARIAESQQSVAAISSSRDIRVA